jgi:hypothetical protein
MKRRVLLDGKEYPTIQSACDAIDIDAQVVRTRRYKLANARHVDIWHTQGRHYKDAKPAHHFEWLD